MKQDVQIESTNSEEKIFTIMSECSSAFFDQTFNNQEKIKELSGKFYKYGHFLYAQSDEQIAGFTAFYSNDYLNKTGYLSMIIVREAFQGKGIGTTLMNACVASCINEGMNRLHLEVNRNNSRAISMYKKMGFSAVSQNNKTYILGKELK